MLKYAAASDVWHDEQDLAHMSGDHLINGIRADFAKTYLFSGSVLNAPEYVPSGSAVNPFYPMLAREPDQPWYEEWALGQGLSRSSLFQDNAENGPAWMQQAAAEVEGHKDYILRNDVTGECLMCGPEIAREYTDKFEWSVFEAGGNGLPKIHQEI